MSGGWGTGWGLTPWGGFLLPANTTPPTPPTPPAGFDIFCFFNDPMSMGSILTDPSVSTEDAGGQFSIDSLTNALVAMSGGTPPPTDDALLVISSAVPPTWTLQVVATFATLPIDFTNLTGSHIYLGAADDAGLAAGVFVSKAGIAYSGAIALNGSGDLVLGGPFQVIPGTAGLLVEGVSYTFRLAVDSVTSTAYVFATETDVLPYVGHQLIAILPGIPTGALVLDSTTVSVRGTDSRPAAAVFDQICLGSDLVMPNLPPRADAGRDQALRMCTIGMLDGTASFDPEGGALTYSWRITDAPVTSSFAFEGVDGFTLPLPSPTGFTNKFHSAMLGSEHLDDPVLAGDVLLVGGSSYSVAATGTDGGGFFVQITTPALVDSLSNTKYKLLRQRALSNPTSATPTFFPDVPGIYKFDLVVFDGQYLSSPATVIANVLESQVPKGCVPDLGFVWQYLSDFWKLVEDRERIQVMWEGMAQVAAAELLSLWQVDYSKSLRDIQRTFQRRWLHYDLRLPEPLPELTSVRSIFSGVSATVPVAGASGVTSTQVEFTSPVHAPVVIKFQLNDPYTATMLRDVLQVKLRGVDPRYTVSIITVPGGTQLKVRVYAPFLFTVGAHTTTSTFQVGAMNSFPAGTAGQRLLTRTYRVEGSLEGLGLVEGDVLVLGGVGYLISRVVDDPTDDYRFQRLVVTSDLPLDPGSAWAIPGHVTSRLLDFYNGLLVAGDRAVFEVTSAAGSTDFIDLQVSAAVEQEVTKLAIALGPTAHTALVSEGTTFQLAYVLRRTRLPVGELVTDIPCLQEHVKETDDGNVLRRNVDYFLESFRGQNSIRFVSGLSGDPGDVWQGEAPPDRLWAEVTYIDNRPAIEANFGIPAEFTLDQLSSLDTDLDYLSAVRGLWYSFINGPTMFNLRVGSQILLGLPFAEEAGSIEEIRTDFSLTQGRILVRDSANQALVRSYSFPRSLSLETNPSTGAQYAVGDTVAQFAPLVQGAEVIDYVKDPAWFQGILNQGVFFEVEKFHKFMVRVDSAAFSLSSLLFVRSFILRVKPTYTYPLFVVRAKVGDTEVSVSDTIKYSGRLILNAGACAPNFGAAQIFDDYRPAFGGVRNQFDANSNPADAAPTYPTPDSSITWGFDKLYLCPEDEVSISWCVDHAGGVVPFDGGFVFDVGNTPAHHFSDTGITAIPAGPGGFTFPGSSTVGVTGTIVSARVVVSGTLGPDPGNYVLVVVVNGVDSALVPVTITSSGVIATLTMSLAVVATDVITLRIRPASGGARSPVWSYVSVVLSQTPVAFQFDNGLPASDYCFNKVV